MVPPAGARARSRVGDVRRPRLRRGGKVDEGTTSAAQQIQVIPYLSHGILTQADADVAAAAAQPQKPRPNPYMSLWMARDYSAWQQQPQQTPYLSLGMDTYGATRELPEPFVDDKVNVPVRPDDVADRFSPSDVASQVEPTNGDNWRLEWSDALPLRLGIIVLGSLSGWRSAFCAGRGSQASRHRAGTPEAGSGARFRLRSGLRNRDAAERDRVVDRVVELVGLVHARRGDHVDRLRNAAGVERAVRVGARRPRRRRTGRPAGSAGSPWPGPS